VTDLLLTTGAVFSDCRRYRYRLWRCWDDRLPKLVFVMLNPSTADETADDATIERCQRRAGRLGMGQIEVANIFAWRSTDPRELYAIADPVGPDNDSAILEACRGAGPVICAWGAHGDHRDRGKVVLDMLHRADVATHHLGLTADGHPRHPLYIGYDVQPEAWL
jgi:hypothetical protein